MKKSLMKFAVVACVAMFAVNSQAEAASIHVHINKDKACCVEQHRHEVKKPKKMKAHPKHHCCRHDKQHPMRRPAERNRKACCHHRH